MKNPIIPLFLAAFLFTGCGVDSTPEQVTEPVVTTIVTTAETTYTTNSITTKNTEISAKTDISTTSATTTEEKAQPTSTEQENRDDDSDRQLSDNSENEQVKRDDDSDWNLSDGSETEQAERDDDNDRQLSDGTETEQDDFLTDPVPEGRPMPVEPQEAEIDTEKKLMCTLSIDCLTIFENMDSLDPDKADILPNDGYILPPVEVEFSEGESVFDVLKRVCMENKIHMEFSWTPVYNSAYIEGIGNLYEFDCGAMSGWMYSVNGWFPNYGCSRYQLVDGEVVEWRYTCDLGNDVGGGEAVSQ